VIAAMPTVSKELRARLSKVTLASQTRGEIAAQATLANLAVHDREPRGRMTVEQWKLRNRLHALGLAGDTRDEHSGLHGLQHPTEATAYENWRRLIFIRSLTENRLLLMPDDAGGAFAPVIIIKSEDSASELGACDGFDLTCRFPGRSLPGNGIRERLPVFSIRVCSARTLQRVPHLGWPTAETLSDRAAPPT
jgi:hypothetical protein